MAQRVRAPGARRGNTNRQGKGLKEKKRIQISMSISDRVEISEGVYIDLRERFENYLLDQGIEPNEASIKQVARQWAYETWWYRLKRAEDEQATIL